MLQRRKTMTDSAQPFGDVADDARVSETPLVDKGFAFVRKIGNGLYATISDLSKGDTTVCNGGFLGGRDAALLVEGFATPAGASFQLDGLRMVSQAPVKGALNTHHHLDHSIGNAFYGTRGVEVWAHPAVARRIVDSYTPLQGADRAGALGRFEKRMKEAKAGGGGGCEAFTPVVELAPGGVLTVPNRPLDPAKLPMKVELGGLTALIESYPGHSGTDMVVRVPEQGYTGVLLVNGGSPAGLCEKTTVSGWRATLETFASWDKDTLFVPGHGQLCGQRGIATLREVFDDIAEQAGKMFTAGVPAEEAQHRYVVPKKFKNFFVFS